MPTLSRNFLQGGGYPKHLLTKSYLDWTPEEAESVRLHFLAPLLHKPHWKDKCLGGAVYGIMDMRRLTSDEKILAEQALLYSYYCTPNARSSTPSPAPQAQTTDTAQAPALPTTSPAPPETLVPPPAQA